MIAPQDRSIPDNRTLDPLTREHRSQPSRLQVPLVDLQAQYATIRSEVEPAIGAVLERCDFVLGEAVTRFEESYAAYCDAPFAVGVDSGFSALELILRRPLRVTVAGRTPRSRRRLCWSMSPLRAC